MTGSRRRWRSPRWLSIESRSDGLAVHAPDFYVWDGDDDSALDWACELHAAAAAADAAPRDAGRRTRDRRELHVAHPREALLPVALPPDPGEPRDGR